MTAAIKTICFNISFISVHYDRSFYTTSKIVNRDTDTNYQMFDSSNKYFIFAPQN